MSQPASVVSYIREAAAIIARDDVERWARLTRALGDRALFVQVDSEAFTVRLHEGRLQVQMGRQGPVSGVGTVDRQNILDLVEGRCTLLEALYNGRVSLTADAPTLLDLAEALTVFIEATVRSRPLQELWDAYCNQT